MHVDDVIFDDIIFRLFIVSRESQHFNHRSPPLPTTASALGHRWSYSYVSSWNTA